MGHRNFKRFLSCHQYQIGQQDQALVRRFLDGTATANKSSAFYDQLKAVVQLKKSTAQNSVTRFKAISKATETLKHETILQQHRNTWVHHQIRLKRLANELIEELQLLLDQKCSNAADEEMNEFYFSIADTRNELELFLQDFMKDTIQPILDLREDIQVWLKENQKDKSTSQSNQSEVWEVIQSVKHQERELFTVLVEEEEELFTSLEIDLCSLGLERSEFKFPVITTGVPRNVIDCECHDAELKCKLMDDFWIVDEAYDAQIISLEQRYSDIRQREPYDGWFGDDHARFLHILDQYPLEVMQRRKHVVDRVQRELTQISKDDVLRHYEWCHRRKLFYTQLQDTINAWQQSRTEALSNAMSLMAQANETHNRHDERVITQQKQRKLCDDLHAKLLEQQQIRSKKIEKEMHEMRLQAEREAVEMKRKDEAEKMRRNRTNLKVAQHKEKKYAIAAAQKQRDRERVLAVEKDEQEQRLKNSERVEYRLKEHNQKMLDRKHAEQQLIKEEEQKEMRLEKLRQQVRIEADHDPDRVLHATEASDARRAAVNDTVQELQEPLFHVYSFNEKQVGMDKRLKIEEALREAGVLHSDYARKIIARVNPPTVPRKGMESSIFTNDAQERS